MKTTHTTGIHMEFPFGLVVRIPGFHPGGPGSIPGVGMLPFSFLQSTYTVDLFHRSLAFFLSCQCQGIYWTPWNRAG